MNNVIFLDIDGPLLPGRMWYHPENSALRREYGERWWTEINKHLDFDDRIQFDPIAVQWMNVLAEQADAKFVLASNWRRWMDRDRLLKTFDNNGLDIDRFHDDWQTKFKFTSSRGHEIGMWMSDHNDTFGLIIDDDGDLRRNAILFDKPEEGSWMSRAALCSPTYSDGMTSKLFNECVDALGVDQEDIMEDVFGIKKLTDEEKEQREKDLDLLIKCMV